MPPADLAAVSAWCHRRRIARENEPGGWLSYQDGHASALEIRLSTDGPKALALGYTLLTATREEPDFPGGLVLFTAWDIWSESFERVGWKLAQGIRSVSDRRDVPLRTHPGRILGPSDFVDAQALLAVALLFQWDPHVVFDTAEFIARLEHDGRLMLRARTPDVADRLVRRFDEGDWGMREIATD